MSIAYSTAQFLPSGVECRFDPKSGKHYYVKQGAGLQGQPPATTTTSWDEPSPYGSAKVRTSSPAEFTSIPLQDMTNRSLEKTSLIQVQVDENLCKKLAGLFPSVQEDDLRILCKRSYNNESLVIGDLTAKGFRPVYAPQMSSVSNNGGGSAFRSAAAYNPTHGRNSTPPPATTTSSNYSKMISATSGASNAGATTTTSTSNNYTSGQINTVASSDWSSTAPPQWMSAIRRTQSPLPNRMISLTHGGSPSSSGSGSPVPSLQRPCYYPGRFVQGVGFEPSSMGGSPHVSGKPFAPLQGRYALSGMITEKSSSPRVHRIQTIARDPNYGHLGSRVLSQSLAYPNMGVGGGGPGVSAQYSYTVSHAMPPPPPPPTSAARSSYSYGHGPPIPSWYGEEDRQFSGSPQPQPPSSPRLYAVVHDAFVKNRVTDRSASPPVMLAPATRIFSPTTGYYGGGAGQERTPTPPSHNYQQQQQQQHHHHHQSQHTPMTTYQNQTNAGGSFYATASRLYAQSPKAARRANTAGSYGIGDMSSTPSPSPHYQVPPRTAQYITPSAMYSQHQQAYNSNRTYSPQTVQHYPYQPPTMLERMQVGHEAAFPPVRSSPGPHSPKIKLRYLRRIYPGVDETVLLDILANADNNVQTAMTELNTMGYVKVDTPPVRPASAAHQQQVTPSKPGEGLRMSSRPIPQLQERPVAPPRRLTEADKQKTRARMLEKVKEIPAAILTIALESVDFDEERAMLLLSNMRADDKTLNGFEGGTASVETDGQFEDGALSAETLQNKLSGLSRTPAVPIRRSQLDERKDVVMLSKGTWTQEDLQFRSRVKTDPKGTDDSLRRGPNRELLTNDLLAMCKGPNTEICKGRNSDLLLISQPPSTDEIQPIVDEFFKAREAENQVKPCGPLQERHRGAQRALAQGSSYKFP